MAERGVTCHHCGASTPLPEDLRAPTFHCAFCAAEIVTASVAGREAVSADALIGHIEQVMAKPPADLVASVHAAPKFEGGNAGTRASQCQRCGASVEVPLDLTVHHFACGACGANQPVNAYISDRERFELDMARQVAGNEALKRLKAEGVACGKCAGRNPVPDDGRVQIVCQFCRATILLGEHADPSAVARNRLKHAVYGIRDEAIRAQERQQRVVRNVVLAIVGVAIVGALVAFMVFGPHH